MDGWNVPNSLPPVGLTGLFQVKDSGATPQPLRDLRFSFAAEDFYYRGVEKVITMVNGTINSIGGKPCDGTAANAGTVPHRKMWIVTGIRMAASALAAEVIRFRPCVQPTPTTIVAFGNSGMSSLTDAVGVGLAVASYDRPFLMGPGYRLAFVVEKITTAGVIQVDTDVRLIEVPM